MFFWYTLFDTYTVSIPKGLHLTAIASPLSGDRGFLLSSACVATPVTKKNGTSLTTVAPMRNLDVAVTQQNVADVVLSICFFSDNILELGGRFFIKYKVEFQPFIKRSYSQLTFSTFYKNF